MSEFQAQYLSLLIKQYYDQPNARAEILAAIGEWDLIYNFIVEFGRAFDVDDATGDRLDKIGKIVGLPRTIPNALTKKRFDFDSGDPTGRGFGSLTNATVGAPFRLLAEEEKEDFRLEDDDYRLFLKAKIAVNNGSAFMVSNDFISLQDVIEVLFSGRGYVLDNQDMTLSLYVPYFIDDDRLELIRKVGLLPKPQGVRYANIYRGESDSFGFAGDVGARGFGSLYDNGVGGTFASFYEFN